MTQLRKVLAQCSSFAILLSACSTLPPIEDQTGMTTRPEPTVVKKYANRRLYHTGTSSYVTLDDLARMVREGEDFTVQDARTGDDITRAVLGQIIFEHENRGQHLLPTAFLRQLIRFYGDSLQAFVPGYLETSLAIFTRDREKLSDEIGKAMQGNPLKLMEEQARRNMEVFSEAMRMWMPFAGPPAKTAPETQTDADIEELRRQVQELQKTLDSIAKK
jgi:polyhydroxyalkanoate synthesis repressor PhaR